MMRHTASVLLLTFLLGAGLQTHAQTKPKAKQDTAKANKIDVSKVLMPQAYIGDFEQAGGTIKREQISALLKKGLTSKDKSGNKYKVTSFVFSYAERMLYEDSLSNLMIVTDRMSEYCPGDTLTAAVAGSIYDRIKPGDTIYIERVNVQKYASNTDTKNTVGLEMAGKGLKFAIIK